MSAQADHQSDPRRTLLTLYDEALPVVYGYFVRRCADDQGGRFYLGEF